MHYYKELKNAKEYIKRAEGFDGKRFIPVLQKYLKKDSTLLEIGMGPGTDVDLLSKFYNVTGSDYSQAFLDLYKEKNPNANLLLLDAVKMDVNEKFDCIYSNKVMHNLSVKDCKISLQRQLQCLNPHGYLFHSFWFGEGEIEHGEIKYNNYNFETIREQITENLEILELEMYSEMEENDSFYIILQKKF
ncbi:MAG: class I SAM-dependent methyltransferase [Candidatus Marinimicrobia bacterium]|nr:class I SAM-dependent methyltransferase [Candidatus Neomarinimicrobiota bacterium]